MTRFPDLQDHPISRSPDLPISKLWLWLRRAVSPCLRGEVVEFVVWDASEEHPHNQVELVGSLAGSINGEGSQGAEFGGEQQIRPGSINEISEFAAVAIQICGKIAGGGYKSTQVAGVTVVFSCRSIEFKFCCRLEFELSPAANRMESMHHGCRVGQRPVPHNAPAHSPSYAANGATPIKLPAHTEVFLQRNVPVEGCRPAIHVAIKTPVLAAVITVHANHKRAVVNAPTPLQPCSIGRLPGTLASAGKTQELIRRRFTREWIENPA